jgi:hypothetical protein
MKSSSSNFTTLSPAKISPNQGVYLAKQRSSYFVIEHYGVIVVGNSLLTQIGFPKNNALVFHLLDKGIQVDYLETSGNWEILGQVNETQISNSIWRLKFAFNNPNYNLLSNNCEQFARYVAEGVKQSTQVQGAGLVALAGIGLGAFIWATRD